MSWTKLLEADGYSAASVIALNASFARVDAADYGVAVSVSDGAVTATDTTPGGWYGLVIDLPSDAVGQTLRYTMLGSSFTDGSQVYGSIGLANYDGETLDTSTSIGWSTLADWSDGLWSQSGTTVTFSAADPYVLPGDTEQVIGDAAALEADQAIGFYRWPYAAAGSVTLVFEVSADGETWTNVFDVEGITLADVYVAAYDETQGANVVSGDYAAYGAAVSVSGGSVVVGEAESTSGYYWFGIYVLPPAALVGYQTRVSVASINIPAYDSDGTYGIALAAETDYVYPGADVGSQFFWGDNFVPILSTADSAYVTEVSSDPFVIASVSYVAKALEIASKQAFFLQLPSESVTAGDTVSFLVEYGSDDDTGDDGDGDGDDGDDGDGGDGDGASTATCFWTNTLMATQVCVGDDASTVTLVSYAASNESAPWCVASGNEICGYAPDFGKGSGNGGYMSARYQLTSAAFSALSCGADVDLSLLESEDVVIAVYSADNGIYLDGYGEYSWPAGSCWIYKIIAVDGLVIYGAFAVPASA